MLCRIRLIYGNTETVELGKRNKKDRADERKEEETTVGSSPSERIAPWECMQRSNSLSPEERYSDSAPAHIIRF